MAYILSVFANEPNAQQKSIYNTENDVYGFLYNGFTNAKQGHIYVEEPRNKIVCADWQTFENNNFEYAKKFKYSENKDKAEERDDKQIKLKIYPLILGDILRHDEFIEKRFMNLITPDALINYSKISKYRLHMKMKYLEDKYYMECSNHNVIFVSKGYIYYDNLALLYTDLDKHCIVNYSPSHGFYGNIGDGIIYFNVWPETLESLFCITFGYQKKTNISVHNVTSEYWPCISAVGTKEVFIEVNIKRENARYFADNID